MKTCSTYSLVILISLCNLTYAAAQKKKILVDVAHGQKFYSDPADKTSGAKVPISRLAYFTNELAKNGASANAEVQFVKTSITKDVLANCDLLFIHVPSLSYSPDESAAIRQYIERGGALFIVMEVDYWTTLAQTNVNDLIKPFGITFGADNPDEASGAHTKSGEVTKANYMIPSHGARLVEGGAPFVYGDKSETPIGVYTEVKDGGKIIAMGDGMVSLYMTSWQGVTDYKCSEFMQDALIWLLS